MPNLRGGPRLRGRRRPFRSWKGKWRGKAVREKAGGRFRTEGFVIRSLDHIRAMRGLRSHDWAVIDLPIKGEVARVGGGKARK